MLHGKGFEPVAHVPREKAGVVANLQLRRETQVSSLDTNCALNRFLADDISLTLIHRWFVQFIGDAMADGAFPPVSISIGTPSVVPRLLKTLRSQATKRGVEHLLSVHLGTSSHIVKIRHAAENSEQRRGEAKSQLAITAPSSFATAAKHGEPDMLGCRLPRLGFLVLE